MDGERDLLQALGRRIRDLRTSKQLSQRVLADRARTQVSYIVAIEKGRKNPTIGMLARIAAALGADLAGLVSDAPTPQLEDLPREAKLPQHVEVLARDLADMPQDRRSDALRVIRAVLAYGGHPKKRTKPKKRLL